MDLGIWRARLYRWRRWLIALAVVVIVRAALPEVIRRVIISQASEALHAQVDVGDVDLTLYRGGVALEDVAVRALPGPAGVPPAPAGLPGTAGVPPAPGADGQKKEGSADGTSAIPGGSADGTSAVPGTPGAFGANPALIAFKRFAIELHYWPLVHKTVQLRDIELVSPRVAIDRLADGDLNLMALVPKQEVAVESGGTPVAVGTPVAATPAAAPPAAAAPASNWKVGLDRFVLKDGRLRFRDLMLADSEPVEVGIDQISVDEIALTPEVYGQPARIHVKLGLDEGHIDVNARFKLVDGQPVVTTEINADSLPLRRARLYVPKVGWSDLHGQLDLDLTYELEPAVKNQLTGTLGLRDVAVNVPKLEDVAVGWKSLTVSLDTIDLLAQRAAVKEVVLDGANVQVRASGGDALPVLSAPGGPAAPALAGTTPVAAETVAAETTAVPGDATPTFTAAPAEQASGAVETPTVPSQDAGQTSTPAPAEAGTGATPTPTIEANGADATPTLAAEEAPPPVDEAPKEPAKPWDWQVASIKITNAKVRVLSDHPPLLVGVTLGVDGLSSAPDAIASIGLALAPPQGTLQLDAKARISAPQVFGGTLKIADLALPPLIAVSDAVPPEVLPSAVLRTDLTIHAGLTQDGSAAPTDLLQISGTIGLADVSAAPPQAGTTVALKDLALAIDHLTVPGVIPLGHKASSGATLDTALTLALSEPQVSVAGEQPMAINLKGLTLTIPSLSLPASLAKLAPADGVPVVNTDVTLDLDTPHVAVGGDASVVDAQRITLGITGASIPVLAGGGAPQEAAVAPAVTPGLEVAAAPAVAPVAPAAPPAVAPVAPAAPPAKLAAQLDVTDLRATTAQGKELVAGVKTISVKLSDAVVPGFVAGASPAVTSEPLTAAVTLNVGETKVTRGDGKEFLISAKAISVPLTGLSMPGSLGGQPTAANPLRVRLGEIRLDAPAIRTTRTKTGIVLPSSGAPAPSPAAAVATPVQTPVAAAATAPSPSASPAPKPPIDVQIQALRIVRGGVEFTDRVVQPPFVARYAPIDVDARNIKYPDLTIKPLKVDISDANQEGKISLAGDLAPDAGTLTLKIDQLNLLAFNSYATAYSPYSVADGTLTIETTAKFAGDKYDVKNDIKLHQLDLAGVEGDSLFEQNFGVPLSMALALLRDMNGDIDLGVPLGVDREGNAQIDLMAVVRSALKQAMVGAISSPLKLLGVGGGGGGALAPAPISFRLGRAEATSAGAQSIDRLAAFLASRPGMAVKLSTSPTSQDVQWLREQALAGEWQEAGFFAKSVALFSQRGPRERIGAYVAARAEDGKPELSAEDQAVLKEWLDERPMPAADALHGLATARLDAVETALTGKGIATNRLSADVESETPVDGPPTVTLRLGPLGRNAAGPADADDDAPAAP